MATITRREALKYLTTDRETGEDTGHLAVPCSRYGRTAAECAPVAWRIAFLVAKHTGGGSVTTDDLENAMSLVVNDHDDVKYIVRAYGGGKYR